MERMQIRQLRIVPVKPAPEAEALDTGAAALKGAVQPPSRFALMQDPELTARQWAVFLLQTAADIEHSLMLQYLYAAYSLPPGIVVPGSKKKDPGTGKDVDLTTTDWARTIAGIAREEMGHMLSVQLLLRALGGPQSFEREHFSYRSQLYPFPFELEPLTKSSLAKYVYAEMPEPIDPTVLSPEQKREILERATASSGGVGLNHVGLLYDSLIKVVEGLPDSAFRPVLADWQPDPNDWRADEDDNVNGVKVLPIRVRPDGGPEPTLKKVAIRALNIIARQGEAIHCGNRAGCNGSEGTDCGATGRLTFLAVLPDLQTVPRRLLPRTCSCPEP
jgi:hypothetical protein